MATFDDGPASNVWVRFLMLFFDHFVNEISKQLIGREEWARRISGMIAEVFERANLQQVKLECLVSLFGRECFFCFKFFFLGSLFEWL